MIHNTRKYFSFFGILIATVNRKLQSFNCMIHAILLDEIPKITKNKKRQGNYKSTVFERG